MKIVKADIYGIHLPLRSPFIISYATFHYMPSIIIKLETDNGLIGWGEAVPDEHVTGENFHGCIEILRHLLLPAVMDKHPFQIEQIHHIMNQTIASNPAAKAAIDIACYDLMGKALNQPIYEIIGGKYHNELTYPKVLSIEEPDVMAQKAKEAVAQGFQSLKLKVGMDAMTDVKRIQAVREAVGFDMPIRVDVNQGWHTYSTAVGAMRLLEPVQLSWVEQPIRMGDIDGLAALKQQSIIPLMADESIQNGEQLIEMVKKDAVDKINIKLMKCGGISPAIHMAKAAEYAGIDCQIGSMVESSIGSAAGYHAAISRKNITSTELTGPLLFSKDIGNLQYDVPYVHLSEQPGLGLQIDEHILEELTVAKATVK
ncbi:L-alanine-DL-glutamate epimerase-like enolase superfamily enzyme [Bacillus ectoiniformans]|uniref:mandelate racemase/muconate lactonizing enzyme family protein n=1 Tax=Bacillus ectoiniformans TaxID=1494429 RepID=UPI00195D3749|nr:dipeptide epimerase [Bacillus ectoiniformans]MBM7648392.1 L-alanine-DL-glutamate epimerase-like enolase superfamily enzyme [Bacillus ectoiniformans]